MRRQRGLLYGLAFMALTGLMANRADAGSITLSVDLNGVSIFSQASVAPDTSVQAVLSSVNSALQGAGSAYRFTTLSAESNFTGGSDGTLQTTFALNASGIGTTAAVLSIDTTQGGFLAPVGPGGALTSSAGGSWANATGSESYTGDFQGASAPTLVFPISGANGSYSSSTGAVPVGAVASGYELSNHFLISLAKQTGSSLGGTGTVTLTTVPEPASVVMLLTGLPMPLVFMGLLRRRKAKA